jgi:uracil-DNA glycosylase family protein
MPRTTHSPSKHSRSEAQLPSPARLEECRRCELWRRATHAVGGEGPETSRLMLVGEQPGDQEDRAAQPFVGPAGHVLNQLLADAGLERTSVYVTNAVKHFKWEPRGKRRLHRRPQAGEIDACRHWLEQEIMALSPRVIVALGATAAFALLRRRTSIEALRSQSLRHAGGARVIVTYHPSAVLRADEGAAQLRRWLLADLKRASRDLARNGV